MVWGVQKDYRKNVKVITYNPLDSKRVERQQRSYINYSGDSSKRQLCYFNTGVY